MSDIIKIEAVSYWSDGGDGGGSTTIYNNLEELRKDQFDPDDFDSPKECNKKFQSALDGDDLYEDGEIGNITIELKKNPDGSFGLAKSLHIHYGQ